ncbi:hypothetical protein Emtol_3295 [Emticicia oligotrophica DSM 17448]|uniref:Uncharacterized protein n=1 Tax=Emticicia oligotrophica (strain DSM 17448 / CIP 109782 / MTCC 6937 / GPTSA100-15) TaxID=929562 RepID=A0ABN4APY6_EMTOG|nr:hypothetical protein [Emticicia oligotrophica]AFK04424.1 hypothetical protein Emtol_3295 [Emticicia oligotrophica DSM 17448]
MKILLVFWGLLFISTFSFAQLDSYRSKSTFVTTISLNKTKPPIFNKVIFPANTLSIAQYLQKKRDCYYLLTSQTSICFNPEINIEPLTKQTKILFFKMKMWGWFVGRNK